MNVHASSDEHGNLKEPKIEEGYRILSMPENVIEALKVRKVTMVSTLLKYAPTSWSSVTPRETSRQRDTSSTKAAGMTLRAICQSPAMPQASGPDRIRLAYGSRAIARKAGLCMSCATRS